MQPLRLLLIEDDPADAALIERTLQRAGYDVSSEVVETADQTRRALDSGRFDLIMADYTLPTFRGVEALDLERELGLDVPVVIVSGTIDLTTALAAMRAGARDFVTKDELARLPSVIKRELSEVENRRKRREAESERDRAIEVLREDVRLAEALDAINSVIHSSLDSDEILQRALEEGIRAASVETGVIFLRENGQWVIRHQFGFDRDFRGDAFTDEQVAILPRLKGTHMPVAVEDVSAEPGVDQEKVRAYGGLSAIGVPLVIRDEVIGLLFLNRSSPSTFAENQLDFAGKLGASVSFAVENARLYSSEQEARRLAESLAEMTPALTATSDHDSTVPKVLEQASQALRASGAIVAVRDDGHWRVRECSGTLKDRVGERPADDQLPMFERVLDSGEPRVIPDAEKGPDEERMEASRLGYRSAITYPMFAGDVVVGVVDFVFADPRSSFSPAETDFVRRLAFNLSLSEENARLFAAGMAAQQQARRELETTRLLLDAADALAEWNNLDEIFDSLMTVVMSATSHTRGTIYLWDEGRREFESASSKGRSPVSSGHIIKLEDLCAETRESVETQMPMVVDFDGVPKGPNALAADLGSHLALIVPLVYRGLLVGVMALDDPGDRRRFSERERQLVEGIAPQAAVAIANARLFESERRSAQLGSALAEVDRAIHSSLEPEEIVQAAIEEAARALDSESAVVTTRESPERWRIIHGTGRLSSAVGTELSSDQERHAVLAADTRDIVAIEDAEADERVDREHLRKWGVAAVLVVPLNRREESAGVAFFNYPGRHAFSSAEIDFARKVGSSITLALENARLYANEHHVAQTLQEALLALPESIPGVRFSHAYQSAAETSRVGGDFYDVFELEHNLLGITVGDISGKGIDAAVLTSLVKNTVRAHAVEKGKTPADVLRMVNAVLLRGTADEVFTTVFFGIFDRRDGTLTYANGGHTATAIVREDGEVVKLPANAPVVGAYSHVTFRNSESRLEKGDVLFLYTDGLIEARSNGEFFGEERLFDLLKQFARRDPDEMVHAVMERAVEFAGGKLKDDLAVLALEWQGVPGVLPSQLKLQMPSTFPATPS